MSSETSGATVAAEARHGVHGNAVAGGREDEQDVRLERTRDARDGAGEPVPVRPHGRQLAVRGGRPRHEQGSGALARSQLREQVGAGVEQQRWSR